MKHKNISSVLSVVLSISMLGTNALPALALGELLPPTPTPNLSTPTPIPTPSLTPTPILTPELTPIPISTPSFTPTPLPSILPSDTTPPVISNVLEASLLSTDATIVWATDELAISTLEYGPTTNYGSSAILPATALLAHTAVILNLSPSTTYYYCIHAIDLFGNTSNSCSHSFATSAAAPTSTSAGTPTPTISATIDTNPPTISDVSVVSLTTSSATINWTTEEVANGEIEYGTTPSYGSTTTFDPALSMNHSIILSGLTANTLYHYRIKSSDEVGNLATSPDNTFTTEINAGASPGSTPSTGSGQAGSSQAGSGAGSSSVQASAIISGVETAEVASSSATIKWMTDIPSDSQVEYGDSSLFGQTTTLDSTLSTSHSVTISGLSPNTNYYFRVRSKPVGISVATVSSSHDFNTLSKPAPVIPPANITAVSSVITGPSSATISATTDNLVTAQIEYGITTEYGLSSSFSLSTNSHSINLINLSPNTIYQYRVRANDTSGNIMYSKNYFFTTNAIIVATATPTPTPVSSSTSPSATPTSTASPSVSGFPTPSPSTTPAPITPLATISNLSVSARDQNAATLTWHTNSDQSDAAFWYDIRYSTEPITEGNFNSALKNQVTLVPQADLVPQGTNRSYIVAGLTPGVTYYFALKLKSEQNNYSALSNVPTTTLPSPSTPQLSLQSSQSSRQAGSSGGGGGGRGSSFSSITTPVNAPTMLNAEGVDGQIVFSWKNPNETSFVRTVLVKKEGGYPISPQDGQTVHEGNTETFTDINLANGKTYYYTIYSYNDAKQYSRGIQVSLAPRQAIKQETILKNPDVEPITSNFHFVEVLKRGTKDIEVEHLQEVLARDEGLYPEKLITGYFGTLTEQALKRFQNRHNLPQTGITDSATQAKLSRVSRSSVTLEVPRDLIIFSRDLSRGSQGDDVAALQKFLIYEGSYTSAIVDGNYGLATVQAVKTFQNKYGVKPVSGYYGPRTRHKVKEIAGL